jgi:hypothetical protein
LFAQSNQVSAGFEIERTGPSIMNGAAPANGPDGNFFDMFFEQADNFDNTADGQLRSRNYERLQNITNNLRNAGHDIQLPDRSFLTRNSNQLNEYLEELDTTMKKIASTSTPPYSPPDSPIKYLTDLDLRKDFYDDYVLSVIPDNNRAEAKRIFEGFRVYNEYREHFYDFSGNQNRQVFITLEDAGVDGEYTWEIASNPEKTTGANIQSIQNKVDQQSQRMAEIFTDRPNVVSPPDPAEVAKVADQYRPQHMRVVFNNTVPRNRANAAAYQGLYTYMQSLLKGEMSTQVDDGNSYVRARNPREVFNNSTNWINQEMLRGILRFDPSFVPWLGNQNDALSIEIRRNPTSSNSFRMYQVIEKLVRSEEGMKQLEEFARWDNFVIAQDTGSDSSEFKKLARYWTEATELPREQVDQALSLLNIARDNKEGGHISNAAEMRQLWNWDDHPFLSDEAKKEIKEQTKLFLEKINEIYNEKGEISKADLRILTSQWQDTVGTHIDDLTLNALDPSFNNRLLHWKGGSAC